MSEQCVTKWVSCSQQKNKHTQLMVFDGTVLAFLSYLFLPGVHQHDVIALNDASYHLLSTALILNSTFKDLNWAVDWTWCTPELTRFVLDKCFVVTGKKKRKKEAVLFQEGELFPLRLLLSLNAHNNKYKMWFSCISVWFCNCARDVAFMGGNQGRGCPKKYKHVIN